MSRVPIILPAGELEWAIAGTASLLVGLGDLYPASESEFTPEIMLAANIATNHFNLDTAKNIEAFRREIIVPIAEDLRAGRLHRLRHQPRCGLRRRGPMPTTIDGRDLVSEIRVRGDGGKQRRADDPRQHNGAPRGGHSGGHWSAASPVSMQIIGRRHAEPLLLDLARVVELERPWPLVAPGSTDLKRFWRRAMNMIRTILM